MSRRKRGTAPQDNSPVDLDRGAYFKVLGRLEEFLLPTDLGKLIHGWNKQGLDASQKLLRAQNLLSYAETHPDLFPGPE